MPTYFIHVINNKLLDTSSFSTEHETSNILREIILMLRVTETLAENILNNNNSNYITTVIGLITRNILKKNSIVLFTCSFEKLWNLRMILNLLAFMALAVILSYLRVG